MLRVEPLELHHFDELELQSAQAFDTELLHGRGTRDALVGDGSYAAVTDDGRTVAIGGLLDFGGGRAYAWAFLSVGLRRHFLTLHNLVRAHLDAAPFHRIEIHVDPMHEAAVRWAGLLGFDREASLRWFFPDGRGALQFARIK